MAYTEYAMNLKGHPGYMKKKDLENLNDSEILEIIHSESSDSEMAIEYFLEKYKGLVLYQARSLFLVGADKEDLLQEGMIGLYKAVREYDATKSTSFYNFAKTAVYHQMCNAINASRRLKNKPLNEYISFYAPMSDATRDADAAPLIDTIEATGNSNPEEFIIDKENVSMIEYGLGKLLSPLEKSVYNLYVSGMDYRKIALRLDRSPKSIDNALQRIRNKLTKWLDENINQ